MIYVIATINIKLGTASQVIEAAMPCIIATRKEAGCIFYDLNQAVEDENTLTFVEQWKTREDLEQHFKQPHMAVWREAGGHYITDRKIQIIHADKIEEI